MWADGEGERDSYQHCHCLRRGSLRMLTQLQMDFIKIDQMMGIVPKLNIF